MRSQGEIKRELIRLRWTVKLPMKEIAERSGVSVPQIMKAMALEASESVYRKLDAFMDAKDLHKLKRESKLLSEIERMTYELWRFWNEKTLPMQYIYAMNTEKQERLRTAMQWRLKKLLREAVTKTDGKEPYFPDGSSYWRLKAKFYDGERFTAPYRKPDRSERPGTVGKGT